MAALRPLLDLHLGFDDFQAEGGQDDGTLAHAIERLYFLVCERAGFDWLKITARGTLHEQRGVTAVSTPQELDRFLARHRLRLSSLCDEARPIGLDPVITYSPPKPRRVLHVTWRAALGEGVPVPPDRRLVVALHGASAAAAMLFRSVDIAFGLLPAGVQGQLLTMPSASRELAQQAGFAAGADLVVLIGGPGLLHPRSGTALLHMSEAHEGRALMELACVPGRRLLPVDSADFGLPWAAGPAIAIPRLLHDAIGGYDERLGSDATEQDYSQRARALGFDVLLCPRALFYADPVSSLGGGSSRRMRETPGIDILTRLYDLADLPHLDQLMFSIMGQASAVPLQLHVMLQRFSFTEVQAVREATWGVRRLRARTSVTLHNWDYAAPFDLRVPLLNWGLEVAQDRYVTCIDVHEQLCPHACATLLARLQGTDVALALGGATLQPVRWWGDVVLPVSGPDSESVPTPIFMADRSRWPSEIACSGVANPTQRSRNS